MLLSEPQRQKSEKLFSLHVGINDYDPHGRKQVSPLFGCENDVKTYERIVKTYFKELNPQCETLVNNQATRKNIIHYFKKHLIQNAAPGVTTLFTYSGHGSYQLTAKEFAPYTAGKKFKRWEGDGEIEEILVCYDSRSHMIENDPDTGWGLADKELAVLINQLSEKGAHVVLIMDCCHSGSVDRDLDKPEDQKARQTRSTANYPGFRPLDSYMDQYYSKLKAAGKPVMPPNSRYVMMAACQNIELAWENGGHQPNGLFTRHLAQVLERNLKADKNLSYARLFEETLIEMRNKLDKQTPVFRSMGFFDPFSTFLYNEDSLDKRNEYPVLYQTDSSKWIIQNMGELYGFNSWMNSEVQLAIYPQEGDTLMGTVVQNKFELDHSILDTSDLKLNTRDAYRARILSFPKPRLVIGYQGDEELQGLLSEMNTPFYQLVPSPGQPSFYSIREDEGSSIVVARNEESIFSIPKSASPEGKKKILPRVFDKITRWERFVNLQNQSDRLSLDESTTELNLVLVPEEGEEKKHEIKQGEPQVIDLAYQKGTYRKKEGKKWYVPYRIEAQNKSDQDRYFALLYFSSDFDIEVYFNETIRKETKSKTLAEGYAFDPGAQDQCTEIFKLIVSSQPINAQEFAQSGLESLRNRASVRDDEEEDKKPEVQEGWFTRTFVVNLRKQHS